MKKVQLFIITVVLTFCMCFSVFALGEGVEVDATDTKETYTISEMESRYKTQGRTSVVNGVLMLDYSASGFEFEAECSGEVSVTFNASYIVSGTDGGCYFTIIVDGVQKARDFCRITSTGDVTVKIAENLKYGKHTFKIYRQTEIERANIGIKSITLAGDLCTAPVNSDLYIEFVGDSVTTACGNLTTTSDSSYLNPIYQDATQGYAYLTAKALGADFSIVARQGIGASMGYQSVSMKTVIP